MIWCGEIFYQVHSQKSYKERGFRMLQETRTKVHPTIDRYAELIGYDPVDPRDYDKMIHKMRDFFRPRGFLNAFVQHRFGILSACEDPDNVAQIIFAGLTLPMRQTNQMDLEFELLTRLRKEKPGLYCETHSSRQESDPEPDRHDFSFPMFEFEFPGDIFKLLELEMDLLEHLGFGPKSTYFHSPYEEMAKHYGVSILTSKHEEMMWKEYGPVVFLTHFPERTSPFFNMRREDGLARKIDVILYGIETIGSAERSTSPEEMRECFHTISDGNYAKRLFGSFTRGRVLEELEDFLSLDFFERSGGGTGVPRMIRALKLAGQL